MSAASGGLSLFTEPYDYSARLDALSRVPIAVWSTKAFVARSWAPAASPIEARLVHAGKLIAAWAALAAVWATTLALVAVLFDIRPPPAALGAGALGTLALAALTTAAGVLVASGSRRRGLLPALVLPAGLPALLAGAQLTTPGVPALPWAVLLTSYAGVLVTASWAVFPALMEE